MWGACVCVCVSVSNCAQFARFGFKFGLRITGHRPIALFHVIIVLRILMPILHLVISKAISYNTTVY